MRRTSGAPSLRGYPALELPTASLFSAPIAATQHLRLRPRCPPTLSAHAFRRLRARRTERPAVQTVAHPQSCERRTPSPLRQPSWAPLQSACPPPKRGAAPGDGATSRAVSPAHTSRSTPRGSLAPAGVRNSSSRSSRSIAPPSSKRHFSIPVAMIAKPARSSALETAESRMTTSLQSLHCSSMQVIPAGCPCARLSLLTTGPTLATSSWSPRTLGPSTADAALVERQEESCFSNASTTKTCPRPVT